MASDSADGVVVTHIVDDGQSYVWSLTSALRWRDGVLEQCWQGDRGHQEWKPVPGDGEAMSDAVQRVIDAAQRVVEAGVILPGTDGKEEAVSREIMDKLREALDEESGAE